MKVLLNSFLIDLYTDSTKCGSHGPREGFHENLQSEHECVLFEFGKRLGAQKQMKGEVDGYQNRNSPQNSIECSNQQGPLVMTGLDGTGLQGGLQPEFCDGGKG